MSDSTNAGFPDIVYQKNHSRKPGVIFEKAEKNYCRYFASLLSRIQELINLAEIFGRKSLLKDIQ